MFFSLGNRRKKSLSIIVLLFVFCLLFCGTALGSEAHHGAAHEADRTGDLLDLLYRFINFVFLVGILFWAIRKSGAKDFFSARVEEIRQRMEGLKREKEETERRYLEAEGKLRDFEEKRKEVIEEFKEEGLAEKEKIIAEAKEKAKQIVEQAEMTIQQEMQSTMDRLRGEVVDLAAHKAQEIISDRMTDKDQDHLVDEFIERVGKTY